MNEQDHLREELSGIVDEALDFLRTGFKTGSSGPTPSGRRGAGAREEPVSRNTQSSSGKTHSTQSNGVEEPLPLSVEVPETVKDGRGKRERFHEVVKQILSCTRCPLHRGRLNAVPGKGSIDAEIVFIGEGPGEMEDIKGEPFVGRAGQLLTKMLAAIDLRRDEVYITNIVKCRPPNNRAPLPDESGTCFPYLERQLELIDPKIICCLGGPAAQVLLRTTQGITKLRGTFHRYRDFPVIPTYHPAAVLRFPDKYKRDVWNDLKMLRDFYRDLKKS